MMTNKKRNGELKNLCRELGITRVTTKRIIDTDKWRRNIVKEFWK